MAELTHLNEPSVVHNLQTRYQSDLIYVSCRKADLYLGYAVADLMHKDIFRTLPRNGKSVLSITNILKGLYQYVPWTSARRHQTSYLCYDGFGISEAYR
jgi:hypothetical protein